MSKFVDVCICVRDVCLMNIKCEIFVLSSRRVCLNACIVLSVNHTYALYESLT